jgi:hAT family C-terminal dimerisation region
MAQENKQKYPRIYLLAMDILPIQASSVPCERVFSSGKETMAPRRRRIKPAFMEKLQMLKYSIRKEDSLNFMAGLRWTDELLELEDLQNNLPPTDLLSYRGSLQVVEDDGDEDWEDEDEDDDDGGKEVAQRVETELIDIFAKDGDDGDDYDDDDLYAGL